MRKHRWLTCGPRWDCDPYEVESLQPDVNETCHVSALHRPSNHDDGARDGTARERTAFVHQMPNRATLRTPDATSNAGRGGA